MGNDIYTSVTPRLGASQTVFLGCAKASLALYLFPPTWITSAKQRWVNSGER